MTARAAIAALHRLTSEDAETVLCRLLKKFTQFALCPAQPERQEIDACQYWPVYLVHMLPQAEKSQA